MFGTITRLDGRRQDELSTGQVVGRATSDLQLIQGLLFMLPDDHRQRPALPDLPGDHGLAVAAADPGRARRGPRPVVHRQAQPLHGCTPPPGTRRRQAAAVAGRGRRRRHRRTRGQGLRAGGAGDRQAARGRPAAVRRAAAHHPAERPLHPGPPGRARPRPGRHAGARRLAGRPRPRSPWAPSSPSPPTSPSSSARSGCSPWCSPSASRPAPASSASSS